MSEVTHVQCFIAAPAELVDFVRSLCIMQLGEAAGSGMLPAAYSSTGEMPVEWWVSSGLIEVEFWDMLQTPEALQGAIGGTIEQCAQLLQACVISGEPGATVLAEQGWLPVNEQTI